MDDRDDRVSSNGTDMRDMRYDRLDEDATDDRILGMTGKSNLLIHAEVFHIT